MTLLNARIFLLLLLLRSIVEVKQKHEYIIAVVKWDFFDEHWKLVIPIEWAFLIQEID